MNDITININGGNNQILPNAPRLYKTSTATNMPRKSLAPQLPTAPQSPN